MKTLSSYLRVSDWIDSKVPFVYGLVLYLALMGSTAFQAEDYLVCAAILVFDALFLSFSYVINDYSDREVDRAAGKHKVMEHLSDRTIRLSLMLLCLAGCLPMLALILCQEPGNMVRTFVFLLYCVLLYGAGAAYSLKPFRFKEKGIPGLIWCSSVQRCLPLLVLLFAEEAGVLPFVTTLALSFCNGLRYILIHQVMDLANDKKSGVVTYVSRGHDPGLALRVVFVLEILLLGLLGAPVIRRFPWLLVALLLYVVFELSIRHVIVDYMKQDWFSSFLAVPLEDLYNFFLPVLLAICLSLEDRRAIFGVAAALLLGCRMFAGKSAFLKVLVKAQLKKHSAGGKEREHGDSGTGRETGGNEDHSCGGL